MKTKNFLLAAVLLISGLLSVNGVFAEEKSDNVTLNIKLQPIQTITVNTASDHQVVDLVYSSIGDYEEGVSVTRENHLNVFSTGGFQVKVGSPENLTNGTANIKASDVTVLATNGTDNALVNNIGAVALGGNETLISSTSGGRDLKYNVVYNNTLGGDDAYINLYDNKGNNTFTAEVTYTIVAQ